MKFFVKKKQKGFSFTEVMISLFVLSIGFLGVIGLTTNTLRNSLLQRDAVTATLLAQEGMELVYNIRDTNIARGADEFDPPGNNDDVRTNSTHGSRIDYFDVELNSSCSTVNNCRLNLISGFYRHNNSGTSTKFARKVMVTGTGDERLVEIMVYWGSGNSFPASNDCSLALKCIATKSILRR